MIALVKEQIQRRDQQISTVDNKQRVYRVLQCQENELTHVSILAFKLEAYYSSHANFLFLLRWSVKCQTVGDLNNSLILELNIIMDQRVMLNLKIMSNKIN